MVHAQQFGQQKADGFRVTQLGTNQHNIRQLDQFDDGAQAFLATITLVCDANHKKFRHGRGDRRHGRLRRGDLHDAGARPQSGGPHQDRPTGHLHRPGDDQHLTALRLVTFQGR